MNDKIQHILAGSAVAVIVGLLPYLEHNVLFCGCWSAITGGIIAGAVKEWTDYKHTNVWDWKDFYSTCIGAVVVAGSFCCYITEKAKSKFLIIRKI